MHRPANAVPRAKADYVACVQCQGHGRHIKHHHSDGILRKQSSVRDLADKYGGVAGKVKAPLIPESHRGKAIRPQISTGMLKSPKDRGEDPIDGPQRYRPASPLIAARPVLSRSQLVANESQLSTVAESSFVDYDKTTNEPQEDEYQKGLPVRDSTHTLQRERSGLFVPVGPLIRLQVDAASPWSISSHKNMAKTTDSIGRSRLISDGGKAEHHILSQRVSPSERSNLSEHEPTRYNRPRTRPESTIPSASVRSYRQTRSSVATSITQVIEAVIMGHNSILNSVLATLQSSIVDLEQVCRLSRELALLYDESDDSPQASIATFDNGSKMLDLPGTETDRSEYLRQRRRGVTSDSIAANRQKAMEASRAPPLFEGTKSSPEETNPRRRSSLEMYHASLPAGGSASPKEWEISPVRMHPSPFFLQQLNAESEKKSNLDYFLSSSMRDDARPPHSTQADSPDKPQDQPSPQTPRPEPYVGLNFRSLVASGSSQHSEKPTRPGSAASGTRRGHGAPNFSPIAFFEPDIVHDDGDDDQLERSKLPPLYEDRDYRSPWTGSRKIEPPPVATCPLRVEGGPDPPSKYFESGRAETNLDSKVVAGGEQMIDEDSRIRPFLRRSDDALVSGNLRPRKAKMAKQ